MLEEGYLTLFIDIQKLHISNALSLFKGRGGGVWGDLLYQKSQERRYEKLLKGRGRFLKHVTFNCILAIVFLVL